MVLVCVNVGLFLMMFFIMIFCILGFLLNLFYGSLVVLMIGMLGFSLIFLFFFMFVVYGNSVFNMNFDL